MKLKIKYVIQDTDRHGNTRVYYREPGKPKVRLRCEPGTSEFFEELKAAQIGETRRPAKDRAHKAGDGTLRWLVEEYKKSAMWTTRIGPKTRQDRARIIERFLENNNDGDKPYALMKKRHMLKRRDAMSEYPAAANSMV